jgi:3-hydroxyacyl-[acyl-carrier-protein] dehydratase
MLNHPIALGIEDIQKLIPHRYPFLFIDRLIIMELGSYAIGHKNISFNEWYFQGHFPSHPILPGVLIVEAMAQSAATLVMKTLKENSDLEFKNPIVYFMSIEQAKFRKPVIPGDILELHVQKERQRGHIWKFKGKAVVADTITDEASFTAMIIEDEAS